MTVGRTRNLTVYRLAIGFFRHNANTVYSETKATPERGRRETSEDSHSAGRPAVSNLIVEPWDRSEGDGIETGQPAVKIGYPRTVRPRVRPWTRPAAREMENPVMIPCEQNPVCVFSSRLATNAARHSSV